MFNRIKQAIISKYDRERTEELQRVRDGITNYFLSDDGIAVFGAIARQREGLQTSGRTAIAIFISEDLFRTILSTVFTDDSTTVDSLVDTLLALEVPIAHLGELPIYASTKLTRAPVFVIGDIVWEIRQ